jgi:hypothetical protein
MEGSGRGLSESSTPESGEGIEEKHTNLIKKTKFGDWIRSRYPQNMKQNSETMLRCSSSLLVAYLTTVLQLQRLYAVRISEEIITYID